MKKKIAILGSTGSIGKTLLDIIHLNNFEIIFLSANKNYKILLNQAKKFKVNNLIITNALSFNQAIRYNKNKFIKIYNNFNDLNLIVKKKLDYVMSSISGIEGLVPTFEMIKFTKKIAIANKESIICAWPLIKKELKKFKTEFIPVDSEHFSLWSEISHINKKKISKIFLTASGGPLLNYNSDSKKNIKLETVLKHPTWKMGKKITVDSATMINKCFEVIEAKKIFDLSYNQIEILIHPNSYVHSIITYKNGISKIILHDTTMKIPIFNTIYSNNEIYKPLKPLNFKILNKLNFQKIQKKRYPVISFLKGLPNKHSMYETVVVSINDILVHKFLAKNIYFDEISSIFLNLIKNKFYKRYKKIYPKNITDIINLNNAIKLKLSNITSI
jgi:1-deoxy-D-xylulose-5-phosphate reductoisomerase